MTLREQVEAALNRLTKWRTVFVGWQIGTRPLSDPTAQALRDHRELTILLRAEVTALTRLLLDKGLVTEDDYNRALLAEAELLDQSYQKRFPGFKSTQHGMEMNVALARDTTAGWPP